MSAVAKTSKINFLYHPKGIAWTIIAITAIWALMQWTLMGITVLAIVVIFLFGFKKPIWAITALLISQMTITSFIVPTPIANISLRLLLMLLTLFILRRQLTQEKVNLGPNSRRLIIPMALLVVIAVISNVVNSIDFDSVFREFRNDIVGILFIILIPAAIANIKQFKTFLIVLFIVATASALVGVLQHFNIMGMSEATLLPGFLYDNTRVPGMGETQLELSYILPAVVVIIVSLFLARGLSFKNRRLAILTLIPMALAIYFTYTRSAIIALGMGLVTSVVFLRMRIRWELVMISVIIIVFTLLNTDIFSGLSFGGRSESGQEGSSVARLILFEAGVAIATDNPALGIGSGRFREVSPQYANKVSPYLIEWEEDRYWSYTTLGNDEPHNDFIMMWLTHGTIALILFVWLHFVIIRNIMLAYRKSKTRFLKGFSVGLGGALITCVVSAFFHNLLATLPLLWILGGFSLAVGKLVVKERLVEAK